MGQFTFSGGGGGGGGGVTSVFGRAGVVVAVNGDYTASNITNVPAGNIGSVTVQAAVNELDTEKAGLALANLFTAAQTIDLNAAAPVTPLSGTLLHLVQVDGGVIGRLQIDSFAAQANFTARRANGTNAAPTNIVNGDALGNFNGVGYGATAYSTARVSLAFSATEDWTDTAQGTRIGFNTTANGAAANTTRWIIDNDGSLHHNGGALTGTSTINAVDYFDNNVNINLIYASLALANIFTAVQTIDLNAAALPAPPSASALHIGGVDTANVRLTLDSFGGITNITGRRANGTAALPSAVLASESVFVLGAFGYGNTAYSGQARSTVNFVTSENWTDTAQGMRITFATTANGTAVAPVGKWTIENDGSLIYAAGALTGNGTVNALGYWHTNVEIIDANRIFRPRSYTIGTLPAVPATGIIHCSDLGGGAGLLSSDGVGWVREDNTGTTTIATDAGHTFTWTRLVSAPTTRGNATLTALRTATLSTADCRNGDRATFVRLGGGAFNWDIAGGTTFSLTGANQYCVFEFDGTTWNIIEAGQISVASGGGGVDVEDEGILVLAAATTLNFVGAGVTATNAGGGQVDITIPGGGGTGPTLGKVIGTVQNASYW